MIALILTTVLACNSTDEVDETVNDVTTETENFDSKTGTIEIKAIVREKTETETTETAEVLPTPDTPIEGVDVPNAAVVTESKDTRFATFNGTKLSVVKEEVNPETGVKTLTVEVLD